MKHSRRTFIGLALAGLFEALLSVFNRKRAFRLRANEAVALCYSAEGQRWIVKERLRTGSFDLATYYLARTGRLA